MIQLLIIQRHLPFSAFPAREEESQPFFRREFVDARRIFRNVIVGMAMGPRPGRVFVGSTFGESAFEGVGSGPNSNLEESR